MISSTPFIIFWQHHPALWYGLSLFLGFNLAIHHSPLLLIPLIGLWAPLLFSIEGRRRILLSGLIMAAAVGFIQVRYENPVLAENGTKGSGVIHIESLQLKKSMFNKKWIYQCRLDSFLPEGTFEPTPRSISCLVTFPSSKERVRPLADRDYYVKGKLIKTPRGTLLLKIHPKESWQPISSSSSWAESRYLAKKRVKTWIHSYISHPASAAFLAGLATGEFDDRDLANDLGRFGLQHIMAISGFHFAIIATILSFLFRLLMPYQIAAMLIVLLLSLYFCFLGISASILRAWVMITVAMAGFWLEKSPKALNSLGSALIITLLVNPYLSQTMGFQLSFLITAGILLFHQKIDYLLSSILLKRPLSEMVTMNRWNQHGYVLLAIFRQGLALTLAVNLFALPSLLYYFHQFPLLSLLYNFFFPFLVGLSMLLLILGVFIPWIHNINDLYTSSVLQLTHGMPGTLDINIRVESFPLEALVFIITALFLAGIHYRHNQESEFTFL